eukprot:jgi/Chlat1/8372/Chrsp80S07802
MAMAAIQPLVWQRGYSGGPYGGGPGGGLLFGYYSNQSFAAPLPVDGASPAESGDNSSAAAAAALSAWLGSGKRASDDTGPSPLKRARSGVGELTEQLDQAQLEETRGAAPAGALSPAGYPQRPGEKDCVFYLRTGTCSFGEGCRFNHPVRVDRMDNMATTVHPERPGQPECPYYMKTGTCKYGAVCKFHHPSILGLPREPPEAYGSGGPPAPLNSAGLPLRPGAQLCSFFMKTGTCKYGSGCKFDHPEVVLRHGAAPAPYPGPFVQDLSHAAPSFLEHQLRPHVSGMQPPPQMLQHQHSLSSLLPADFPYASSQSFPSPNQPFASVLLAPEPTGPLPQRPGELDCAFYMKTGKCKYLSSCKFNHPPGIRPGQPGDYPIAKPPVKLSATGLPLRKGEPACAFYMKTGSCKFGATCKFDHPSPADAVAAAMAAAAAAANFNGIVVAVGEPHGVSPPRGASPGVGPEERMS